MNLLLLNHTLSVQSVYLCLKEVLFCSMHSQRCLGIHKCFTYTLFQNYYSISTDSFFVVNFPSNVRNVQGLIIGDTAIFIYLVISINNSTHSHYKFLIKEPL